MDAFSIARIDLGLGTIMNGTSPREVIIGSFQFQPMISLDFHHRNFVHGESFPGVIIRGGGEVNLAPLSLQLSFGSKRLSS